MSEQETKASLVDELDEREERYIDFSNGAVVEKELRKAFAEYKWPDYGVKTKSWKRDKKGSLRPRKVSREGLLFCLPRLLKILALNARNFPIVQTAMICGVTDHTIYCWIKRGIQEGAGPYWIFARALTQMRENYKASLQGVVHRFTFAGGGRPTEAEAKMALAILERQFPKDFGGKLDITSGGKPLRGGQVSSEVHIRYMAPGPDGKPVMVAPPKTTEKHVLDEDE